MIRLWVQVTTSTTDSPNTLSFCLWFYPEDQKHVLLSNRVWEWWKMGILQWNASLCFPCQALLVPASRTCFFSGSISVTNVMCFEFRVVVKYPVMDGSPRGAAHCRIRAICHQHEARLCQAAGLSHVLLLMKCQYYLSPSNIYAKSGCLGSEPLDRQEPSMVLTIHIPQDNPCSLAPPPHRRGIFVIWRCSASCNWWQ